MPSLKTTLTNIFAKAIQECFSIAFNPAIQLAGKPEFGDFQANFALGLAKQLQLKPFDVANQVVSKIKTNSIFAELSVAGPGFINIRLSETFLSAQLDTLIHDSAFQFLRDEHPQTIVVDYGGANVAKEMHVGHLRSAAIGDTAVRILSFLGHHVIRQNHLGDWGTQFGMLIEYLLTEHIEVEQQTDLSALNDLYKKSKEKFDADENFAARARARVVLLQQGDVESFAIWQKLVKQSEIYYQVAYERLGVLLKTEDNRGESFYNPRLPSLVEELLQNNIAQIDNGAAVIFMPEFVDQNKEPLPMLIRKSDGAFLYATTDLAAAEYRIKTLGASRIIIVTDARQKLHFHMLFAALKKIGLAHEHITLQHLAFGTVLGPDKKPFKTRSGETVKLADLLDEAERRALAIVSERNPDLSAQEKHHLAHVIGIGALKYADLSNDLVRDYVFDWDRLLSFEGNTAPYLQNAYVRIQAIFRKGTVETETLKQKTLSITAKEEHTLAIKLLEFSDVINTVANDLTPHKLCTYLYELASRFHQFYEACPILNAETQTKDSRLLLCLCTGNVLKQGLHLLGIEVMEKM